MTSAWWAFLFLFPSNRFLFVASPCGSSAKTPQAFCYVRDLAATRRMRACRRAANPITRLRRESRRISDRRGSPSAPSDARLSSSNPQARLCRATWRHANEERRRVGLGGVQLRPRPCGRPCRAKPTTEPTDGRSPRRRILARCIGRRAARTVRSAARHADRTRCNPLRWSQSGSPRPPPVDLRSARAGTADSVGVANPPRWRAWREPQEANRTWRSATMPSDMRTGCQPTSCVRRRTQAWTGKSVRLAGAEVEV